MCNVGISGYSIQTSLRRRMWLSDHSDFCFKKWLLLHSKKKKKQFLLPNPTYFSIWFDFQNSIQLFWFSGPANQNFQQNPKSRENSTTEN